MILEKIKYQDANGNYRYHSIKNEKCLRIEQPFIENDYKDRTCDVVFDDRIVRIFDVLEMTYIHPIKES